jgi:hypothetical protein
MPLEELRSGDPQQFGPYRLLGRLGSGGMGRVFLGRSPGGRLVAVKVIRAELADSADFRERFAREVAAARKVGGSFTAPVVDSSMDDPVPWLATAYVRGLSLEDAVARNGPLHAESVLALAAGLAEGLGAIHAAGVVHRDLKPSNVLLAEDGPRVIDFGISRAGEATALTRTGLVIGSPGFMSPEQAEGREVGPASDVFSLGAVLVFAGTGEGPFGSGSTAAMVYRIVHGQPQTSQLSPEIRSLAERCLAKDPQERPATGQILAELDAIRPPSADLAALQAALTFQGVARPAVPAEFTPGATAGAGGADTPDPPGLLAVPDPEPDDHHAGIGPAPIPAEPGTAGPGLPQAQRIPEGSATLTSMTVVQGPPGSVGQTPGAHAQEAPATPAIQGTPVCQVPRGPASPITSRGDGPRAEHGRRRWAVAVIAAAAALSVITGLLIWAPWVSPSVLRPAGLKADPSTVSSVTFSWSGPATGPAPDRYVIFQDGIMIGSVPGTITSYQGKGLAPDTVYQYQVEAVRGGQRSPRSPIIVVSTLTPPVSAAVLSGPWTVHYKVVTSSQDLTFTRGSTWTDKWRFTPDCAAGPCAVTLSGIISGPGNTWPTPISPTLLARAGAVYSGTTTMANFEYCSPGTRYPIHTTVRFRIVVSDASVAGKHWKASSWTGTMEVDNSYTRAGATYCSAFSWSAALHGIP